MKVCIVCFANLRVTPFLSSYTALFEQAGIAYDVVLWDRYGLKEACPSQQCASYQTRMDDGEKLGVKFVKMANYARYVKKLLTRTPYDFVVVLTSLPGVFLEPFLRRHYDGRYLLDIRDYSYERLSFYYKRMDRLMAHSGLNVISSPGFTHFLPQHPAIVCHNCTLPDCGSHTFRPSAGRLHITFVGVIRFADQVEPFLQTIRNDARFQFDFYGFGYQEARLKAYCAENGYENVTFHGAYAPAEKESILQQTDLLFNAYGKRESLRHALSNKYYEALYYKKPLLVNAGTAMQSFSGGLSFAVDETANVADALYAWYHGLDGEAFDRQANALLSHVLEENRQFVQAVLQQLGH